MTLQLLNQYRDILEEIPDLKSRINRKKREVSSHVAVLASMTEPPYTVHRVHVDADSQEDMQETLRIMQRRLRRIIRQRREIEQFIDGIPDSQLRRVFQLRFIDGLDWQNVTMKIGGGNAEITVKQKVYRYLKVEYQCNEKR